MRIEAPCVVSLSWKLHDARNQPIDELVEPAEFFFGGRDLLAKVEEALRGQTPGSDVQLQLEPEHAFGEYRAELVCFESRDLFPAELEAGMSFDSLPAGSRTPNMPADQIYIVTEVYPSHVVLDANHPLAGMALRLHIRVHGVREASAEEVAAGSVSGTPLTVFAAAPVTGQGTLQ
jgi:FKBP-type peptidyl-prolyl cis-trans isomerase SlyD